MSDADDNRTKATRQVRGRRPDEGDDDPFASWFEPGAGSLAKPVSASVPPVDVSDEEFHLQDWTAPPTGVVPKVVGADPTGPMTTTGPVFRGASSPLRDDPIEFDDLADGHLAVGALNDGGSPDEWDEWEQEERQRSRFVERDSASVRVVSEARPSGRVPRTPRKRDTGEVPPTREPAMVSRAARNTGNTPAVERRPRPRRRPDGAQGAPPARSAPASTVAKAGIGGDRNMGQAVGIGLTLIVIGIVCFMIGSVTTMLLVTVVIGFCMFELIGALRGGGFNPAGLLMLAGTVGMLWGAYWRGPAAYPVVLGLLTMGTLVWFLVVHPGDQQVMNAGATILGTLYVAGLGSFAALIVGLPVYGKVGDMDGKFGVGLLVAAVVASVSYDVAGYFVGRQFGGTPLGATLRAASPNKTQEGMIGGVVVSILATLLFLSTAKLPIFAGKGLSLPIGLASVLCALAAPFGDLCESMIKRDLDVKDMSQTLPGHGGVLDRFDGLLFVLPVAYFVALYAH